MPAQREIIPRNRYEVLMANAASAMLSVDEVFAALRHGEINEAQCKQILSALEKARVPKWQRALSSL